MEIGVVDSSNPARSMYVKGSASAMHVAPPDMIPAALAPYIKRDLSTTMQTVQFASGAKTLTISYRLLPGATAVTNQFAKFVINAASDADAAGKLATDGAFVAIAQGDDVILTSPSDDPILRIDYLTEQAVGAEKTIFQIVAGV